MSYKIAFLSQKGGIGKSSLSRALAVQAMRNGATVCIADLNSKQASTKRWAERRAARGFEPAINVVIARDGAHALTLGKDVDLLIIDGPGEADAGTMLIATNVDLTIQSAKLSIDDLEPLVNLFQEMVDRGVDRSRLAAVVYGLDQRLKLAELDYQEIKSYIEAAGFQVVPGFIRNMRSHLLGQNSGHAINEAPQLQPRLEAQKLVTAIADLLFSDPS